MMNVYLYDAAWIGPFLSVGMFLLLDVQIFLLRFNSIQIRFFEMCKEKKNNKPQVLMINSLALGLTWVLREC